MKRRPLDGERVARGLPVHRVSEHRMTEVREVDPHLVRSSAPQLGLDERRRVEVLDRPDRRVGGAPAPARGQRRASRAGTRAPDPSRHDLLDLHPAADEREVAAIDGVPAELALKVLGGGVGEREHEHARGALVQPMDDARAPRASRTGELGGRTGQDGVLLRLDRRVDEQARRLVDHEDVRVAVEHLERRGLRDPGAPRQVGLVAHDVGGRDPGPGIGRHRPVDDNVPDEDLALRVGERGPEELLDGAREPAGRLLHRASVAPVDSAFAPGLG